MVWPKLLGSWQGKYLTYLPYFASPHLTHVWVAQKRRSRNKIICGLDWNDVINYTNFAFQVILFLG